jgi:hypothetical protein
MGEQSHRDAMNAAIRAQRERQAVRRSTVTQPEPQAVTEPRQRPRRGLLARLLRVQP